MKKIVFAGVLLGSLFLGGCSSGIEESMDSDDKADVEIATKQDTGSGKIDLLTPTIEKSDNELEFMGSGIDETKTTFVYVANKKVFEGKIKNNQDYSLDITGIKGAHATDYKPKVQFVQYKDNKEDFENGEISMFKQVRYTVK